MITSSRSWSSGRAAKFLSRFATAPRCQGQAQQPTNDTPSQFELAAICRNNTLTKGVQSVWNFSARPCNQRRQNNGPIMSQRKAQPGFSSYNTMEFSRQRASLLDLGMGDTSESYTGRIKNLGTKCQPKSVTRGGVACGDEFKIVSLDSTTGEREP